MRFACILIFALAAAACGSTSAPDDPPPDAGTDAGPTGAECCAGTLVGRTEFDACCLAYLDAGSR